ADPSTTTDPADDDTDGDGLIDGWTDSNDDSTFQFEEGEDANLNGAVDKGETDPNDIDSDSDGLLDGPDVTISGTPPETFSSIFHIDNTYWGELSYESHDLGCKDGVHYYQKAPTDPTVKDSDGDGLVDGVPQTEDEKGELEQHFTLIHLLKSLSAQSSIVSNRPYIFRDNSPGYSFFKEQNIYTDPSQIDTDGDGLSDGLEVNGWENNIIYEKTKEKAYTIPKELSISNPAYWDMDLEKFLSKDTDEDGLSDFEEFQNSSNPLLEDTDGDGIYDFEEGSGNCTMIEGSDPEIVGEIQAKFVFIKEGIIPKEIKIEVTVHVRDNAGLDHLEIKCQGAGTKQYVFKEEEQITVTTADGVERTFTVAVRDKEVTVSGFKADYVGAFFTGYDIYVKVWDINGYGVKGETHLDSVVQGIIKAILAALLAFIKAVMELASKVFEWIWDFIRGLLDPVVKVVSDAMSSIFKMLITAVSNFLDTLEDGGEGLFDQINNMMLIILALGIVVITISLVVRPFLDIVGSIIVTALAFVTPIILSTFNTEEQHNDYVENLLTGGISLIENIIREILRFFIGDEELFLYLKDPPGDDFGLYDPEPANDPTEMAEHVSALSNTGVIISGVGVVISVITALIIYWKTESILAAIVGGVIEAILGLIIALLVSNYMSSNQEAVNKGESPVGDYYLIGLIGSIIGILLGIYGLIKSPKDAVKYGVLYTLITVTLSFVAVILGGILAMTYLASFSSVNEKDADDNDGLSYWQDSGTGWKIRVDKKNKNGIFEGGDELITSTPTLPDDWDTDDDGLPDGYELAYPSTGTTRSDSERKTLLREKGCRYVTNPNDPDTDGDGLMDGGDIAGTLFKTVEGSSSNALDRGEIPETIKNSIPGLSDNAKVIWLSKPVTEKYDTDDENRQPVERERIVTWEKLGWQITDGYDVYILKEGSDGNSIDIYYLDPSGELLLDWNGNGKLDKGELTYGSNPAMPDTDLDGVADGKDPVPTSSVVLSITFTHFDGLGRNGWRLDDKNDSTVLNPLQIMELTFDISYTIGERPWRTLTLSSSERPTNYNDNIDLSLKVLIGLPPLPSSGSIVLKIRCYDDDPEGEGLVEDVLDIDGKPSNEDINDERLLNGITIMYDLTQEQNIISIESEDINSKSGPDANGVYTIEADGSTDEPPADPAHPFDARLTF
ncbi:MAG: hypothetical protein DRJ64_06600, partial [Thermoprotei archaeon]